MHICISITKNTKNETRNQCHKCKLDSFPIFLIVRFGISVSVSLGTRFEGGRLFLIIKSQVPAYQNWHVQFKPYKFFILNYTDITVIAHDSDVIIIATHIKLDESEMLNKTNSLTNLKNSSIILRRRKYPEADHHFLWNIVLNVGYWTACEQN